MYQIALCDDKTTELDKVQTMINSYAECHTNYGITVERFTSAEELIRAVNEEKYLPDVLFMDIYMPEKTGIEAARELRKMRIDCRIIFLTTSKEHALDAFHVDARQYMVKPVLQKELFSLLGKIFQELDRQQKKYLMLRIDNKDYRIGVQDIIYCEAQKKRQNICLVDGTNLQLGMTMSKIYEMLVDYKMFAKVGISYIVNMEHIVSLSVHEIQMDNSKKIYPPRGSYLPLRERYFDYYCKEED